MLSNCHTHFRYRDRWEPLEVRSTLENSVSSKLQHMKSAFFVFELLSWKIRCTKRCWDASEVRFPRMDLYFDSRLAVAVAAAAAVGGGAPTRLAKKVLVCPKNGHAVDLKRMEHEQPLMSVEGVPHGIVSCQQLNILIFDSLPFFICWTVFRDVHKQISACAIALSTAARWDQNSEMWMDLSLRPRRPLVSQPQAQGFGKGRCTGSSLFFYCKVLGGPAW
eukprot:6486397-Amphidinium_carterae.1